MDCFYLQCPLDDPPQATAHPNGYTQFVTLFAVPAAYVHGSYLCPSSHFVYSILRFLQFRFIHWLCYCFRCMVFNLTHKAIRKIKHTYRFAIPRFISLHFRSTSSFIHFSRIQSTAAYNFACLAACYGFGFVTFFVSCTHSLL